MCMCVWDPLVVALLQLLSVHYPVFTEISGFYCRLVRALRTCVRGVSRLVA
uniref:Uncharacterized protein n=1 Tax=Anguilla anguilla TaxID=7936 RepID=A0A0E9XZ15_ANGAN